MASASSLKSEPLCKLAKKELQSAVFMVTVSSPVVEAHMLDNPYDECLDLELGKLADLFERKKPFVESQLAHQSIALFFGQPR